MGPPAARAEPRRVNQGLSEKASGRSSRCRLIASGFRHNLHGDDRGHLITDPDADFTAPPAEMLRICGPMDRHPFLERVFRRIVALRLAILAAYAVLLPLAIALSLRIPSEGAIDRLIVPSDPDFVATRAFQKVFPEGQVVLLLLESDDPWSPDVLKQVTALEERLGKFPGYTPSRPSTSSAGSSPGSSPTPPRPPPTGSSPPEPTSCGARGSWGSGSRGWWPASAGP